MSSSVLNNQERLGHQQQREMMPASMYAHTCIVARGTIAVIARLVLSGTVVENKKQLLCKHAGS